MSCVETALQSLRSSLPMTTRAIAPWAITTALALSTACGGSVKVDDGSGGSGNTGGTGGTGNVGNTGGTGNVGNVGNTGGTGNVGATGGSGGSPSTTCDAFCDVAAACFELPDCPELCADLAADECGGEWLQLASCLAIELAPSCSEGVCLKEQQVYSDCTSGGECIDQGCSGGPDGSCTCDATCFGQSYFTSCGVSPNGQVSCSCFVEGELWGNCSPFEPGFACGIEDGCCASIFFFDG